MRTIHVIDYIHFIQDQDGFLFDGKWLVFYSTLKSANSPKNVEILQCFEFFLSLSSTIGNIEITRLLKVEFLEMSFQHIVLHFFYIEIQKERTVVERVD